VAPGESPFHVRGTAYIGHLEWLDRHFPGGRAAFLAALTPPMRAFFNQTFLAISMHDFLPLAAAGQVCARVMGKSLFDFVEMRARHQAAVDIEGVYKILLKLSSPRLVATRLPKIMSNYFDFGETSRLTDDEPLCVRFQVATLPQLLVEWFTACYTGYVEVVLGAAGGHLPTIDFVAEAAPDLHGFAASRLTGIVRWS
jgi:hypothetical protein